MWSKKTVIGLFLFMLGVHVCPGRGEEFFSVGQLRSSGPVTTEASKKIVSRLRALMADFKSAGITRETAAAMDVVGRFSSDILKVDRTSRVQAYVYVIDTSEGTLDILGRHGLDIDIVNSDFAVVQGWIPVENLEALASESVVLKIRPPSYGTHNVGSVTSQGDAIHRCDGARALGFTGAGVRAGVVSDGVSSLAASQASGDLPGVQVLNAGSGDEGIAILEIIYDCAPGAALAFSSAKDPSGFTTTLAFAQSVNALASAGAHLIIDDVIFLTDPSFEDGLTALNDRAVGSNVLRISAAGNDALAHYQGMFTPGPFDSGIPMKPGTRHDFGGGDTLLRIRVPASPGGTAAALFLQWGNRVGGAGDDYDLCVRRTDGSILVCSLLVQDGNDDPIEAILLICFGSFGGSCPADIQITLYAGSPRLLELYCAGPCLFDEFNVVADSVFGHQAAPEVLAVAASPASAPDIIEPFSAAGPATILFPVPEMRFKPDLTGIDGVATTRPGFNPFFGTSAAAAHVAGGAALVMQANPSYQLGPPVFASFLREALKGTAMDLGPPGPDVNFGFGRADALNAIQNELGKARCQIRSDRSTVKVGEQFTVTVETFPGAGDPWDIYVVGAIFTPGPVTLFSLNFASGTLGPANVIQPARPTAPIIASSQSFAFVAPFAGQVGGFCLLADPGLTRISPFSFVAISFTP